ncbi:MAG TPA: hypothetical protein VKE40_22965 [Gemmataceae bacterium]|nr:hypothetical protein [Gemmataceae bacterium]
MRVRLFATVLALAAAPLAAFGADEENPYKKAKVGDYATYKTTMKFAGMTLEGTMTQTVTAKSEKEATVTITTKMNGMDFPERKQTIDLTKPYDPLKVTSDLPAGVEAKVEKLKDGTEKLKVGDKSYDCKWETFKMKAKAAGLEIDTDAKVWQSKDTPLQLVKMEVTGEFGGQKMAMEMELSETGSKKD